MDRRIARISSSFFRPASTEGLSSCQIDGKGTAQVHDACLHLTHCNTESIQFVVREAFGGTRILCFVWASLLLTLAHIEACRALNIFSTSTNDRHHHRRHKRPFRGHGSEASLSLHRQRRACHFSQSWQPQKCRQFQVY